MSNSPPTITVSEQHALLDALLCKKGTSKQFRRGVRNYAIACLMLEAGLRVGEVVQLTWDTLYWNSHPVTSIIISEKISKKGCERQIPVSTRLSDALKTYLGYYSPPFPSSGQTYVFYLHSPDKPLTTRQVERIINKAAWSALGRPIHPHVLRHTFATKLMKVTNMRTVQELLGHKNLASTQVYTHPSAEDKKKAISSVELNESP